jgi:hypothetical protein
MTLNGSSIGVRSMSATQTSGSQAEGFAIRPPTTMGDDGTPSNSVSRDLDRVVRLVQDERHLTAHALLEEVRERLKTERPVLPATPKKGGLLKRKPKVTEAMLAAEREYMDVEQFLLNNTEMLETLEVRTEPFPRTEVLGWVGLLCYMPCFMPCYMPCYMPRYML